ncbi:MAG TPA: archease [Vicinamibacterales bacterium]|nr:archease [Vicinamibacterales bacterium]
MAVSAVWEHFPHGADVGVRGIGPTKEDAFQQVALALTAVVTDPTSIRCVVAVPIVCRAPSDDLLLADWLNAIVYEMATRHVLFGAYSVMFHDGELRATAWGEAVEPARHQPAVEIKGATYTALRVERVEDDHWLAQCVVDV